MTLEILKRSLCECLVEKAMNKTPITIARALRARGVSFCLALLPAAGMLCPATAHAQWSATYEQFYLPGKFNWEFRRTYPGADRLFNAFDYGHAILYERLYNDPGADSSILEDKEYNFITRKLLVSPPNVPLEEAAIEVAYAKIAPEAKMMFDWAHLLHRQIYDVLASEGMSQSDKDAKVAQLVRYYKTRRDLAFSSVPKNMDLMEGQPYSLAFRNRYPKFNGLIWGYHWLQVGLYEPLMVGTSLDQRQAGVAAAVARFRQMLDNAPEHMPRMMPMTAAVAPTFAQRYPEASIIFDNLHSMHDVVSDILASPKVPHDRKRAEILTAASRYRDATSFAMTPKEWVEMAQMMGIENMGGPAVGFLSAWPTPTIARGAPAAEAMKNMGHGGISMPGITKTDSAATKPGVDRSKMPGMGRDTAGTRRDTSRAMADMPGMSHPAGARGETARASGAALMMDLHMRLLADPLIRARVMGDSALRRLMITAMGDSTMMPAPKPAAKSPPKKASPPSKAPSPTAKKSAVKSSSAKTTPAKKPADPMAGMKGMDHSKMPGMKMPPDTSKKRPPE
jgi:hypothetical protein